MIAALKLAGIEPIVAADFSAMRRSLATRLGAHEVVDPGEEAANTTGGVGDADLAASGR